MIARRLWRAALAATLDEPGQRFVYRGYLASISWRRSPARRAALARAAGRCEGEGLGGGRCHATHRLHAHHLTYTRVGRERAADLRVLCADCHRRAHRR